MQNKMMAKLLINGKTYDARYVVLNIFGKDVGRYVFTDEKPVITGCARIEIYDDWITADWFKKAVPDFRVMSKWKCEKCGKGLVKKTMKFGRNNTAEKVGKFLDNLLCKVCKKKEKVISQK